MAKKAKQAKKPAPTPRYLQGRKSVNIPAHRVSDVMALIHKHGHGAKFKREAKAAGVSMSLNPKTVNFIKDFVAKNEMHATSVGGQVINSNGSFDCTKP